MRTLCLLLVCSLCVTAQDPQKPKTKLEAFAAATGSVVVRGFSKIGTIKGTLLSMQTGYAEIKVNVLELTNATTGTQTYGVTIDVTEVLTRIPRFDSSRAYVDYDDLDSLLAGIRYLGKVEKSVTSLDDFQADYVTGDLTVSTYSSGNATKATVTVQSNRAVLSRNQLAELGRVVKLAKGKIDAVRAERREQR